MNGNELREWRTKRGMTREKLAVAVGFSHAHIVAQEQKGNRPISENVKERIDELKNKMEAENKCTFR